MPTTSFATRPTDGPVHFPIWLDRSSKDGLSVKENRKRTASTCSLQDWKTQDRDVTLGLCDDWKYFWYKSSRSQLGCIKKILYTVYIPEANGQIYARRSLHSPTAGDGRKALVHFLSASPANTPRSSQSLQQQEMHISRTTLFRYDSFKWFDLFHFKSIPLSHTGSGACGPPVVS